MSVDNDKRFQVASFAVEHYLTRLPIGTPYEKAREIMWQDIASFLAILLKNEYIAVIFDDDTDIIIVQYEHDEKKDYWGGYFPYWLSEEEYTNSTTPSEITIDELSKEEP